MSTRLYLIRHGESTWNAERRWQGATDPPLSGAGRAQALRVGEALRAVPVQAVYSSPLERAMETAAAVAAAHTLTAEPVAALREMAFGEWESLLSEEVEQRFGPLLREWWKRPEQTRIPGAEPLDAARARVMAALRAIMARHAGERVVVVAHGGVNKLIVLSTLGAPLSSFWRIKQDNACVNVLEYQDDRGRVLICNDTTHLRPDARELL